MLESTRLTQFSSVSSFSLLSDLVCVAIIVVGVSFWAVRVVFRLMSSCLLNMIVFPEVVSSPKKNLGKFDFVLLSSFFFDDNSSLAS